MPADVKSLINAWLGVLAQFLRFFNEEKLNELADKIDEKFPVAE